MVLICFKSVSRSTRDISNGLEVVPEFSRSVHVKDLTNGFEELVEGASAIASQVRFSLANAFSMWVGPGCIVENTRHPFMHRPNSLDYAMVLKGENWMMMDEEEDYLLLRAGDVLIQRGNKHAWSNRGTEPSVIAIVLIDGVTQPSALESESKGIPITK